MTKFIEENGKDEAWRDGIRSTLKLRDANVEFEKANGQMRKMLCTLREECTPEYTEKGKPAKRPNDDVIAVWDLDISGWRSFRFDKLTSIEFNT
jgi:hypothetical protein